MEHWNPRSLLMLSHFQETKLTIYLVVFCYCFFLWCMPLLAWFPFSSFFFKFLTSTDKERIKCMEHTLCCLVCLLHEPELLSFQIIIDEKHGDLILFCTKLGTKHTSDYCRIDTALCLIIFIFLVYYVSSSLTYFRSPIVKMVIF